METKTLAFKVLRSDYEEAKRIMQKYIERNDISIQTSLPHIQEGYWIFEFEATGLPGVLKNLRDELEKNWLIVREDLA